MPSLPASEVKSSASYEPTVARITGAGVLVMPGERQRWAS